MVQKVHRAEGLQKCTNRYLNIPSSKVISINLTSTSHLKKKNTKRTSKEKTYSFVLYICNTKVHKKTKKKYMDLN